MSEKLFSTRSLELKSLNGRKVREDTDKKNQIYSDIGSEYKVTNYGKVLYILNRVEGYNFE